jgi:hypothetical protein
VGQQSKIVENASPSTNNSSFVAYTVPFKCKGYHDIRAAEVLKDDAGFTQFIVYSVNTSRNLLLVKKLPTNI